MNKLNLKLKVRGFGLIEILIGMLIASGILISLISVISKVFVEVYSAENGDFTNSVMQRSIEYLKSPESLDMLSNESYGVVGVTKVYKVEVNSVSGSTNNIIDSVKLIEATNQSFDDNLTDCSTSSEFYVKINNVNSVRTGYISCIKVLVVKENPGFKITVVGGYKSFDGKMMTNTLLGYRQNPEFMPTIILTSSTPTPSITPTFTNTPTPTTIFTSTPTPTRINTPTPTRTNTPTPTPTKTPYPFPTSTRPYCRPEGTYWCTNHGGIAKTVTYNVSNWYQCYTWCYANMTTNQVCQYNADGPRNCWVNYPPSGNINNCIWKVGLPPNYTSGNPPPYGSCK